MAVFRTDGNPHCHVILRGGKSPNYDKESVTACEKELEKAGLGINLMIDCSHGNSNKDHVNQKKVLADVAVQIQHGNNSIIGVMLESNLEEGNQPIPDDLDDLKYGVSVTDACIDWNTTEVILREFAAAVSPHLEGRSA